MPIPRSHTWLLLAATIVLQIAIIRSATVLKHSLKTQGTYDPTAVYKRDPELRTLLSLPYSDWYNSSTPTWKPAIATGYLLLLSFLFSFIGIVASDFFCPNLSTIATYLGLSETTAGVTFLAFGNGSPDVFSTFSAMNQGTFSLAIGELLGAATFITSVVVGSIAFIRPFYVPKTAFIRDVSFFTAAVIVLVIVLRDGHLTLIESTAMVSLYLLYVVVVVVMNVMTKKDKRHANTSPRSLNEGEDETGWKSLPGTASGGFRVISPATSRPTSIRLPSPHLSPVEVGIEDGGSTGTLTPTAPRRPSHLHHAHTHAHFANTPNDAETPRANFSLLGAIEFRDVVNSLKREGASRTPSPGRSPYTAGDRADYFSAAHGHGHRRSVSQAAVPRRSSTGRSRAISHVVHPGNMATFTMAPNESASPTARIKLGRTQTAPGPGILTLGQTQSRSRDQEDDQEGEERLLSPVSSDSQNPWKDQSGNPPRPVLPKLSIPDPKLHPNTVRPKHGTTPSISIMDPSGHVEEPVFTPPSDPVSISTARGETRFRFRHRTRMILRVLFPSLQSFRHKSIIGMILSIFSVPAILVLTLTLPVVDDGNNDREGGIALPESSEEPLGMPDFDLENGSEDEQEEGDGLLRPEIGEGLHHLVEGGFSPLHSPLGRIHHSRRGNSSPGSIDDECCGDEDELDLNRDEALEFNKSLTAAQCVFGPTFCAYIIFSDMEYMWYILLASSVLGIIAAVAVMSTATHGRSTFWRMVRCFGGFTCSMVWIAAIADEVVSVLQAIGELMGLSDAIIGLTIFAIGNSMADLVANITVAQFAPAMAYAACFGGPMLNLLLGVGGSGTYHLLSHPHLPVKLHFSPTLWVSATGLIIILLATAIVVPLNGYLIDRRWATVLVCAYGTLMIVNIVVEIKTGRA